MFKKERDNYTLYGALFGLTFPVVATLIELSVEGLSVSLENIVQVQQTSPLLWIIDTAPLFLGIFARFGGMQLDAVKQRAKELKERNMQLAQVGRRSPSSEPSKK